MLIAELGLAPGTTRALRAAGISSIDLLQQPANELLAMEQVNGAELYDVACRPRAHGLGLPTKGGSRPTPVLATEGDLEILRLRVIEGLALRDSPPCASLD